METAGVQAVFFVLQSGFKITQETLPLSIDFSFTFIFCLIFQRINLIRFSQAKDFFYHEKIQLQSFKALMLEEKMIKY